jgi:hypothetical protein
MEAIMQFADGSTEVRIRTVGALIEYLKDLPAETPVKSAVADDAKITIYNLQDNADSFVTITSDHPDWEDLQDDWGEDFDDDWDYLEDDDDE